MNTRKKTKERIELTVKSPQEYVEPLSHIFTRYGDGVVVELAGGFNPDELEKPPADEQWAIVKTYLPIDATTDSRRAQIDIGVRLVAKLANISPLQERTIKDEEWEQSWKEGFNVLHIGKRIVIRPTWRRYQPKPNEAVVDLDPGMAFGTGHHPTTLMCLLELEALIRPEMRVLDVGTGSAILAMTAAKLGAAEVMALDIDPVAVEVAQSNVAYNHLEGIIKVCAGTLPSPLASSASFDLVLANISAKAICQLSHHLIDTLKTDGALVVSGMIQERQQEVVQHLGQAGGKIERVRREGEWVTIVASKVG